MIVVSLRLQAHGQVQAGYLQACLAAPGTILRGNAQREI
jgi:hypothetical protein